MSSSECAAHTLHSLLVGACSIGVMGHVSSGDICTACTYSVTRLRFLATQHQRFGGVFTQRHSSDILSNIGKNVVLVGRPKGKDGSDR